MKSNIESSMAAFIQKKLDRGEKISESQQKLIDLAKKNLEIIEHVPLQPPANNKKVLSLLRARTNDLLLLLSLSFIR